MAGMKKTEVLSIIDEVMNNREIDSIRNAILAIRDKVIEFPDPDDDWTKDYVARLKLRGAYPICFPDVRPEGATHICIDTSVKIDTDMYGIAWYE